MLLGSMANAIVWWCSLVDWLVLLFFIFFWLSFTRGRVGGGKNMVGIYDESDILTAFYWYRVCGKLIDTDSQILLCLRAQLSVLFSVLSY